MSLENFARWEDMNRSQRITFIARELFGWKQISRDARDDNPSNLVGLNPNNDHMGMVPNYLDDSYLFIIIERLKRILEENDKVFDFGISYSDGGYTATLLMGRLDIGYGITEYHLLESSADNPVDVVTGLAINAVLKLFEDN